MCAFMLVLGGMLWVTTGCRTDFNEIEEIPPVVFKQGDKHFSRKDVAYHFGYQRGYNSVTIKTPKDVNVYMMDNKYKEVDYYWFREFSNWFKSLLFENGIMSLGDGTENLDCDNYAMLYKSLSSVAAYKSKIDYEPCVVMLVVQQHHEFGGVPGTGGLHMVNLVMTNQGWYVIEPQTGVHVLLEDYPNQEHVQFLLF